MKLEERAFGALFAKIERDRGFRGTLYRQKCLRRRVAVRMRARGVKTPEDYAAVLDRDPAEYDQLLRVLTINVSRFFRNPETWAAIRRHVLPDLLHRERPITAWSAGSAGGEETYSLAILTWEELRRLGRRWEGIRIVGTDIDSEALRVAHEARYPSAALEETAPEIRGRWFTHPEPHRLKEPIPSLVEYRRMDLLSGRPGIEADLILCRNLLIYFDREAQRQVFQMFVEVLRQGGYLVLGRVETLSPEFRSRFEIVDARERVYRKS